MPDQLNKQSLINLLIDSPLREPIKINLIDIVNNTAEPDLPKVYSTITKELEIFQKATDRRMKLAEETISKLGGTITTPEPTPSPMPASTIPSTDSSTMPVMPPAEPAAPTSLSAPSVDLPPLPQAPQTEPTVPPTVASVDTPLPPTPTMPTIEPAPTTDMPASTSSSIGEPAASPTPNLAPLGGAPMASSSDEDALAEIQKELDSLKTTTANEISTAAAPASPAVASSEGVAPTPAPQA